MSTILKGAPVVAAMNEANAARCAALREKGVVPTLAVVRVVRAKMTFPTRKASWPAVQKWRRGEAVPSARRRFAGRAAARHCRHQRRCRHPRLSALPPPAQQFDDRTIRAALSPEKDIDGITDGSLAGVFTNTAVGYPPCTAQACLEILKFYNIPLSGRRAVVVGRSLVVGKPAAMMLDREKRHRHPLQLPHPEPARCLP